MRILLLGKDGQVGWELQRALAPLGQLLALGPTGQHALSGDLSQPKSVAATVRSFEPDVVVNAAAYTAVDRAESEPEVARIINAIAPGMLATEAAALGAWMIHYSTDYVFDGSGTTPWSELDPVGPLNVYGRTKLEGEELIRASGCRHLILRTSWVYAARGNNFARTMLRLAAERDSLAVIDDQFGAPTGAELLADVTAHSLGIARTRPEISGTYHVAAGGETSWYGYACHVIAFARAAGRPVKVEADAIRPVATSAFPTPARRPLNSRLATAKLQRTFGLALPDWTSGVDRALAELLEH